MTDPLNRISPAPKDNSSGKDLGVTPERKSEPEPGLSTFPVQSETAL